MIKIHYRSQYMERESM